MATLTPADTHAHDHHHGNYITCSKGIMSWLITLDHKRIGVMYVIATLASFLLGGLFALGIRTELIAPGETIMDADTYNRFFTLHGAIMTFLVIIPAIPGALGNFVLPIMLGAKDVAFPRLNLMSFYLWVLGAGLTVYSMLQGGIDTGWTFYTPYSIEEGRQGVFWVGMGVFILGFSSIFTGLNFIVTVQRLRPPGMTWFKLPLFLWALYATAIIQVLATPVLGITMLLLAAERIMGIGIFDPALGGDPVLFQHFFWFYSHPAVYIMILPAMGIISELISVHCRREIFGYKMIAFSSVAIAFFSFLVWGHHMFTSGQSPLMNAIFSAITFSVAIPSAVKVFNWILTMYKGSISFTTPMLYALAFLFIFAIGGLTGLPLAVLSTDVQLHDTYFVVAHFHYVMMGSTLIAMIGGLHHWWPKITGRMYNERLGQIGAWIVFIGFNLTFFTQFMLGTKGMPRRYHDYQTGLGWSAETTELFHTYHFISTMGSYVMAVGFFLTAFYLLQSLVNGRKAPANPWGGASLEWECSSPPPHHNFDETPTPEYCYNFDHWVWSEEEQGYVRRDAATS